MNLNAINAFFVRNDIIRSCSDKFVDEGNYQQVIRKSKKIGCHAPDKKRRKFISYKKALKYCN